MLLKLALEFLFLLLLLLELLLDQSLQEDSLTFWNKFLAEITTLLESVHSLVSPVIIEADAFGTSLCKYVLHLRK